MPCAGRDRSSAQRREGLRERMIRFSFLPSDFHPMVLFLGEAPAMRHFAGLLRTFAKNPVDMEFESSKILFTVDNTKIRLTNSAQQPGMQKVPEAARSFVWNLESWQAELFADMVEELAEPDCKSGSALLEAAHGEIKVKVSLGEYTEDFLTKDEIVGRQDSARKS